MATRHLDRLRDVRHVKGRVRRRLEKNQPKLARSRGGVRQAVSIAGSYGNHVKAEWLEQLVHEVLRTAVERLRVEQRRAPRQQAEEDRGDRRHAGVEDGR